MNRLTVFLIRLVLAVIFAFILNRFFHPGAGPASTLGLAVILTGLAYLFDFLRSRRRDTTS